MVYLRPWYCLELSTLSIASFKPGSIVLRSPSISFNLSISRVIDLRLIAGFPALSIGLPRIAGFPAFSGFSSLSVDLGRVAGIPALSSIVGLLQFLALYIGLRDQASISGVFDLPRLSRWSYIIIEFFRVTRLSLRESPWI